MSHGNVALRDKTDCDTICERVISQVARFHNAIAKKGWRGR
jgi:hypothetical protein